jgi:hypothetical protein
MTFAASAGDIIDCGGGAGTVDTVPGVRTITRVTPFDVLTVVRPSGLTSGGGAGIAPVLGGATVTPGVAAPYAGAPYEGARYVLAASG